MELSEISPDTTVLWQWGFVKLNLTIVTTWAVMALLAAGSWAVTRSLSSGPRISRWQNFLEVIVETTRKQIREVVGRSPGRYLPFVGSLFLFIAFANALSIVPGYVAPTGSLSTTAALALCVFVAVPAYGIVGEGWKAYLAHYVRPTPLMLPFQVIGEVSRTLALAVRLFGNVMSATKIVAILLVIAPIFFPIIMHALGLLTGLIHAYIFAILALVYISAGVRVRGHGKDDSGSKEGTEGKD
jgi:F-type H+-transporting ATPase subunit a